MKKNLIFFIVILFLLGISLVIIFFIETFNYLDLKKSGIRSYGIVDSIYEREESEIGKVKIYRISYCDNKGEKFYLENYFQIDDNRYKLGEKVLIISNEKRAKIISNGELFIPLIIPGLFAVLTILLASFLVWRIRYPIADLPARERRERDP